jgi:hypothetical protein
MIIASHRLAQLYKTFGETEVTFNAQVILSSGLLTGETQLKVGELHLPCVLYACSMKGARIIAETSDEFSAELARHGSVAALRLGFRQQDEQPVTFFVSSRVENLAEYNPERPRVRFIALSFLQKPADDLIGILGALLEINANVIRRRDERIVLTTESMKKIGMISKESCIAIGGAPRRCIVSDLSFSGAKILVTAPEALPGDTRVVLKLTRCEMKGGTVLDGSIVRVEDVQGRNDIVALSIHYMTEPPISYKQKINSYFAAQDDAG